MLSEDLKVLEKISNDGGTWSHHRAALRRIKEFVELAQQTTNKPNLPCSDALHRTAQQLKLSICQCCGGNVVSNYNMCSTCNGTGKQSRV